MPSKLIIGLLCVSGFVLGIGGSYGWEKVSEHLDKNPDRKVASAPEVMGKHQSSMSIRILQPDVVPSDDYTEVELKAYITKRADSLGDIQFVWNLPEGVISSDALDGTIQNLATGGSAEVIIRVRGFNKLENKSISLEAHAYRDQVMLGTSALVSSRPEDSMEYIAPIMAEVAPNGPAIEQIKR